LLSRRSFLNSTFGAGLASAASEQAAAQTPAVQPAHKRLNLEAAKRYPNRFASVSDTRVRQPASCRPPKHIAQQHLPNARLP
jgi:hypothetical protein